MSDRIVTNRFRTIVFALLCAIAPLARGANNLIVHEWGTFTSLQDENGNAIGGINTNDEPVPNFVHNIAPTLLLPINEPPLSSKSVATCHSDITMRLETPVIYFHPSEGFDSLFDVKVQFRGGWLTQYFPNAIAEAPGISQNNFGPLTPSTMGSLAWNNVSLVNSGEGPATNAAVWTTPRRVNAANIEIKDEREKFLFYRGVGHLDAPLRVVRSGPEFIITKDTSGPIDELWLADVRADGTGAFRPLHPLKNAAAFLITTPATFRPEDYSSGAMKMLKSALQTGLINAGLFQDEANALLDTWEVSYFKSAGLRLFFFVPRNWTDVSLPLTISSGGNCSCPGQRTTDRTAAKPGQIEITRVMVGRIELITPEQRGLLARIAAGSATAALNNFQSVGQNLSNNDPQNDPAYRVYLQLGRFRNALVLDEQKRNPTPVLDDFIQRFRLHGYEPWRGR